MKNENIEQPATPERVGVGSKELLACPFCGGDAEADMMQGYRRISDGRHGNAVAIYCTKCTAQVSMCHEDFPEYSPEDLMTILRDAWNIRHANAGDHGREIARP